METSRTLLKDLLILTKDGEWGNSEPTDSAERMLTIRGTDFAAVRSGEIGRVPLRYIKREVARRKALKTGDILIETAGGTADQPTGRTLLLRSSLFEHSQHPVTCASFARFLRVDRERVVPEYLFWYLQELYRNGQMHEYHLQHTGVARFQYTLFASETEVLLPSLQEQGGITAILEHLDNKIELNRRMNQTLESMARAIFRSWFVDFDPVVAKAAGRQPFGMSPDVAALFPDELVSDEKGEIPFGWHFRPLAEVTTKIGSGATPRGGSAVYVPEGTAFIRSQNVLDHEFEWNGLARITDEAAQQLRGVTVREGDILLNITGESILRTCLVESAVLPARVSQHVAIIRPSPEIPPRYLHLRLVDDEMKEFLIGFDAGGTRQAVTKAQLETVPVLVPLGPLLIRFDRISQPLFQRIDGNRRESRTLAALRDALLPKLMSGQLRVRDAEKLVGTHV